MISQNKRKKVFTYWWQHNFKLYCKAITNKLSV